jgi:hypothetical protein
MPSNWDIACIDTDTMPVWSLFVCSGGGGCWEQGYLESTRTPRYTNFRFVYILTTNIVNLYLFFYLRTLFSLQRWPCMSRWSYGTHHHLQFVEQTP